MTRTSILKIVASLFAAVLPLAASTSALHAQSPVSLGQVKVPFAFEAGTTHFEPGTYTLEMVGENTIVIHGEKTSGMAIANWNLDTKGSGDTRVVFHHLGDQYFMREIWDASENRHLENIETSGEAKARKALKTETAGSTVPHVDIALLKRRK